MDDEGARAMLTDEKILEVAANCLTKDGKEGLEYDYSNSSIINFVRKLLSEVRLEDMLNIVSSEIQFIYDNEELFIDKFYIKKDDELKHITMTKHGVAVFLMSGNSYQVPLGDYLQWKQTIEGGE